MPIRAEIVSRYNEVMKLNQTSVANTATTAQLPNLFHTHKIRYLSSNEVLKYREKVLKYKYIRELLVCSVTGTHRHHNCTM